MRTTPALALVFAALLASPRSQGLDALLERLQEPDAWHRAVVDLRRCGPRAADALAAATEAAVRARTTPALARARALAALDGSAGAIPALLRAVPLASVEVRDELLRALGNCVLVPGAGAQLAEVDAAIDGWARAGLCYSPASDHATFAWYEYVRLRRRLALAAAGSSPDELLAALGRVRDNRVGIAGFGGDTPADQICNLGRFGQHGEREAIEAIAQLVLLCGEPARASAIALAEYLGHEPPRPGEVLTEWCAGIGENAPTDAAAVRYPTLWRRDDWRFAVARAVLALDPEVAHRQHALRHLLHAPAVHERLDALATVRAWPPPWTAFAPDLSACLAHSERGVVREALVTLGLADADSRRAISAVVLRSVVDSGDPELAMLAGKLLQRR